MGMASYHDWEDLRAYDVNEIREWKKKSLQEDKDSYWFSVNINDNGIVSLQDLDGCKIISYWYPNFVKFLRELSVFIKGKVKFVFETGEECALIKFDDYNFSVEIGEMKYTDFSPEDLLFDREKESYLELSEELKNKIMVDKL